MENSNRNTEQRNEVSRLEPQANEIPIPSIKQQLKIVSMNLAGCQPSAEAPPCWTSETVTKAVKQELLHQDPDILALQECPIHRWPEETFHEAGYTLMGTKGAHAGYVALLVRNNVAPYAQRYSPQSNLPVVMTKLVLHSDHEDQSIILASCHLAPFGGAHSKRSMQIKELLKACGSIPLIVAGDTNMRTEEDQEMETTHGLFDAWKEAGADPSTRFTWDTRNHEPSWLSRAHRMVGHFNSPPSHRAALPTAEGNIDDQYFNRFYGAETREYATRYDRIYFSDPADGSNATGQGGPKHPPVSVKSFQLIANKPVGDSRFHFLSDHFGIACTVNLH